MTSAPSSDRTAGGSGPTEPGPDREETRAEGHAFGRVLVPGERPEERRSRRLRRLVALAAVAAVTLGAYHLAGGDLLSRAQSLWTETPLREVVPSRQASVGVGPGPDGDAAADTSAAVPGRAPSPSDPLVAEYRDRAEVLTAAARRFRERGREFRQDRIGCPELARGYEAVDRAMVALARVYVEVRDRLEAGQEQLFERAMAGADSAGRIFDASGCERLP